KGPQIAQDRRLAESSVEKETSAVRVEGQYRVVPGGRTTTLINGGPSTLVNLEFPRVVQVMKREVGTRIVVPAEQIEFTGRLAVCNPTIRPWARAGCCGHACP